MMQAQCPKCKEVFNIGYTKTADFIAGSHANKCKAALIPIKAV